jgi:hypothetical protein
VFYGLSVHMVIKLTMLCIVKGNVAMALYKISTKDPLIGLLEAWQFLCRKLESIKVVFFIYHL